MTHTKKMLAACVLSLTVFAQPQQSEYHDEIMDMLDTCFLMAAVDEASLAAPPTKEQLRARAAQIMIAYSAYANQVYLRAHNAVHGNDDPADRKAVLGRYFVVCVDELT